MPTVSAYSPGRVNLIGDHTDYNEGVALPMAIDLGTTVTIAFDDRADQADTFRLVLRSGEEDEPADVDVHFPFDPDLIRRLSPRWARVVAAVVASVHPGRGGRGTVATTLPVGAGLSSSAALQVALAMALGCAGTPESVARLCQRAEEAATGVACGLMDQLTALAGVQGAALLIDFAQLTVSPVSWPEEAEVVVVHSGQRRVLEISSYAARRAECEAASFRLGPLGQVGVEEFLGIPDPLLRRRARHVVTECDRVRWFVSALDDGDLAEAGRLMTASHQSLARDFEVSTPALDDLVAHLDGIDGVYGARLTGAGFGGCVVALCRPGALDPSSLPTAAWRVQPSAGARVLEGDAT